MNQREVEIMMAKTAVIKTLCRQCKIATNHTILYKDEQSGVEEEYSISWQQDNSLIRCQGCDNIALYRYSTNSDMWPDEDVQVFPDPVQGREPIRGNHLLPTQLRKIYVETLKALDSELQILSGIGVRSIIEMVCKDRKAKGKNLEDKINALVPQGVLTQDGAKLLHKLRILGNNAAHEAKPHSTHELSLALDVVNHLLLGVYILPRNADEVFK